MAIIKCKMCGGDLNIVEDSSVCECEYCGTKQTVPKVDDEKKIKLFERANRLRAACEFDKAAGVYESIVADFDEEAEAYWGLILCKFGIEYVDDPATGNKIPTCHRSSFDSLMDDANFDMVMECADPIARRVYRDEAKAIEELRKRIIEVSSREEPYDVFISYKELDDKGERTLDSVIAQDIYTELTDKGYRVFFSRISLESKLGVEYEPYIFAALNSAKVMLVVGTDYDYFNAVWVKNEWSRFLALIASGQKKTLIPVFKGIDAYDMPKEFSKLAAQDMGKVGAMQDLVRGVEKILGKNGQESSQTAQAQPVLVQSGGPNATALLDRGNLALEDSDWDKAKELFDQVLNMDSRNAEAYLGLAMAEAQTRDRTAYATRYTAVGSTIRKGKHAARARQFSNELSAWFQSLDELARHADEKDRIARDNMKKRLASLRVKTESTSKMIAAGGYHTVGLKADGSVLAVRSNFDGQCGVSGWSDIVAVAARSDHTVGLKADGSVVAVGENGYGQCGVSGWSDIVAVAAGGWHTVGLKADGRVVAVGYNNDGRCGVSGWSDIVAVAAGSDHTVGLKADGSVLAVGGNYNGRCEVSGWKLFDSVETIEAERKAAEQKAEAERKAAEQRAEAERKAAEEKAKAERKAAEAKRAAKAQALKEEQHALKSELADLHGLFTGKRRREIEARLAEIEAELKKLG